MGFALFAIQIRNSFLYFVANVDKCLITVYYVDNISLYILV